MIYTIIDIETTGLRRGIDDILEFGYIRCDPNTNILGCDSVYFYKPEFNVENPDAQAVHHLTREMLEQHEGEFSRNMAIMCTVMKDGLILGKNSSVFDIPFIYSFVNKYAPYFNNPEISATADMQDYYTPRFREWYKARHGIATRKRGTLEELIQMLGLSEAEVQRGYVEECKREDRAEAHSALYDAYMTLLLARNYLGFQMFGR